jgi:hypothetical protein
MLKAFVRFLVSVAKLIAGVALLIVGYVWLTGPPYDATLERQFSSRESDLEQLVVMAQQDKHLDRIAPDFTWLDTDASWPRVNAGLSPERWNRYRDLFRHAGLPVGIIKDTDDATLFPIYHAGIVPAGFSKGYVYSEKPLSPIVGSLDRMPTNTYIAFKHFRKNWYIYRFED